MRTTGKKTLVVVLTAMVLAIAGAVPASAQQALSARGSAYGISLTGLAELGPEPTVEAAIPPGGSDRDVLLEVPLEGVLYSGTAAVEADAVAQPTAEARWPDVIQSVNPDAATSGNGRGYAVVEELTALEGDLLTADLVAAEALATCVGDQATFATGSQVQNATLAGSALPLEELQGVIDLLDPVVDALEPLLGDSSLDILIDQPNDVILEVPELGIRLVAWETNWDGGTGTTDGSDTVWVNALRLTITGALGDILGDQDLTVAHAEATANCGERDPLAGITKAASSDVVAPGDTFTYTIDIPNQDPTCTLTDVNVVDTITGPAGSSIISTEPQADSIDGMTVTWNDVGPIAPGESVRLVIGVQVPNDAPDGAEYSEQLRVTADCDGIPVDGGLDFVGPRVSAPAPPGGPPLPRTGGGAALLGGMAFMAFGAALRRFRG